MRQSAYYVSNVLWTLADIIELPMGVKRDAAIDYMMVQIDKILGQERRHPA